MGTPASRSVLFDLDGTCVDSDDLHFQAYRSVLWKSLPSLNDGRPITRAFYDRAMSGRQNRAIMAELAGHLPEVAQTAIWQEKERVYCAHIERGVQPIRGLLRTLDRLDALGVSTAVVTNAPRAMAVRTLQALGVWRRFEDRVVIGEECAAPKPAPDPYRAALALLHADAARSVAFEDSPSGIASAKAAGLFTVGVLSSRTAADLRLAGADLCVRHYEDDALWPCLKTRLRL